MGVRNLGLVALGVCALMAIPSCSPAPTPGADAPATAPAASALGMGEASASQPVSLDLVGADGARLSGDPVAGGRLYRALCQSCHAMTPGLNGTGPSLHGVVGRAAGAVPGFAYSQANRSSGLVWTHETLFAYLERPQGVMPGTTMVFSGVSQPQRRADLIAYLSQESQ